MKLERVTFLGSEGQKLAARLDAPDDAAHPFALSAQCFTCGKDVFHPLPGNRVCFEQSECFSGFLVPLFRSRLERDTKRGVAEMNAALKRRAEGK